ncbi:hypothetical protein CJZ35_25965, partial [Salmonella enterica subsp. enterica serovar Braenderup]
LSGLRPGHRQDKQASGGNLTSTGKKLALPGLTLTNNVPDKVREKAAVAVKRDCQGLAQHPQKRSSIRTA